MAEPAKLRPADLAVGRRYLNRNGVFIRHIDAIKGRIVFYHEPPGNLPHQCSRTAFLKACPTPATSEDEVRLGIPSARKPTPATPPSALTPRDEANALTAYAFRNGFLEELHAGKHSPLLETPGLSRITDPEMKRLMIETSSKLARILELKAQNPAEYTRFLRAYSNLYCRAWNRE